MGIGHEMPPSLTPAFRDPFPGFSLGRNVICPMDGKCRTHAKGLLHDLPFDDTETLGIESLVYLLQFMSLWILTVDFPTLAAVEQVRL